MSARSALVTCGLVALSIPLLGAKSTRPAPGRALPYPLEPRVDRARQDELSRFAAGFSLSASSWREVAQRLEAGAERRFGALNAMDRYWLGSAWWAHHQPRRHERLPDWAHTASVMPNLVLHEREGGNCETSATGHAALLTAMGVPTEPVYGWHCGAREGHVWTVSDVGGHLMFADVHVARTPVAPWHPRARDVMRLPSREAAFEFDRLHTPDNMSQRPR